MTAHLAKTDTTGPVSGLLVTGRRVGKKVLSFLLNDGQAELSSKGRQEFRHILDLTKGTLSPTNPDAIKDKIAATSVRQVTNPLPAASLPHDPPPETTEPTFAPSSEVPADLKKPTIADYRPPGQWPGRQRHELRDLIAPDKKVPGSTMPPMPNTMPSRGLSVRSDRLEQPKGHQAQQQSGKALQGVKRDVQDHLVEVPVQVKRPHVRPRPQQGASETKVEHTSLHIGPPTPATATTTKPAEPQIGQTNEPAQRSQQTQQHLFAPDQVPDRLDGQGHVHIETETDREKPSPDAQTSARPVRQSIYTITPDPDRTSPQTSYQSDPIQERPQQILAQGHMQPVQLGPPDQGPDRPDGRWQGQGEVTPVNPYGQSGDNEAPPPGRVAKVHPTESIFVDMVEVIDGQTIQDRPSPQVRAAPDPADPDTPSIAGQLATGIRAALTEGRQRITIELHPPELGRVLIQFRRTDNWIDGRLEVDNRDTYLSLERSIGNVTATLHSQGIHLKHMELYLNEQPISDEMAGKGGQGQPDQRQPSQPEPQLTQGEYQPVSLEPATASVQGQLSRSGDGSIDVLA